MLQAMEGLKILQNVMDDCFSRVSSRIAEEKSRLGSLNQRVATAQLKIQAVRGSKTATTVYSTPKYPASDALKLHKPVTNGMPFQEYPVPAEDDKDDDGHRFTPSDNPALLRKDYQDLIALYGRLNPDMSTFSEQLKPGLGKLPHRLESVDSVLLFGTNETPYKQYNVLDALRGQERAARKEEEERRRALFAQPRSMLVGDEGIKAAGLSYDFVPKPQAMGELAFPTSLAGHFGQIATDQNFDASQMEDRTAYNVPTYHRAALPALPSIEDFSGPSTVPAVAGAAAAAPPPPPPPPPTFVQAAPAPPPPPPTFVAQTAQAAAAPPTIAQTAAPPPPPAVKGVPAKAAEAPAERNDLLAAIQKGFKLKKAKKQNKRKAKLKKPTNPMEELRMKLERRRRGLGGAKKSEKKKAKRSPMRAREKKPKASDNMAGMKDIFASKQRKASITSFDDSGSGSDSDGW